MDWSWTLFGIAICKNRMPRMPETRRRAAGGGVAAERPVGTAPRCGLGHSPPCGGAWLPGQPGCAPSPGPRPRVLGQGRCTHAPAAWEAQEAQRDERLSVGIGAERAGRVGPAAHLLGEVRKHGHGSRLAPWVPRRSPSWANLRRLGERQCEGGGNGRPAPSSALGPCAPALTRRPLRDGCPSRPLSRPPARLRLLETGAEHGNVDSRNERRRRASRVQLVPR